MEEYHGLTNPLVDGVFVPDGKSTIVNPYASLMQDMGLFIASLRLNYEVPDLIVPQPRQEEVQNQDYLSDMNLSFPELLKQEGLNIIVTSTLRPGAKTKQGRTSHHSHKDEWGYSAAIDFRAADGNYTKLLNDIYSNPRIRAWLVNHKKGILEETTLHPDVRRSSGADKYRDGLLHLGPDLGALRMSRNWGLNYDNNKTYRSTNSNYTGPIDGKMGSKAYPLGGGKSTIDPNGMYSMFHSFGYGTNRSTKRTGVECAKVVARLLMSYMDKGCRTLQDLIMMYHLGMSGTWDSVKAEIRRKGGLRDLGTKKWIPAEDWIRMQETYLKHCSEYMHMPMSTRVSKSRDFLYPLITFISRLETSKNSEAATAIALQQMRIA